MSQFEPEQFYGKLKTLLTTKLPKINSCRYLDTLPFGIYYLIYNTLWKSRENPPSDWPAEAYYLLWREDLAAQALKLEKERQESSQELLGMYSSTQLEDVMPGK